MKHFFSSFRVRQVLVTTLLGSIFALSFYGAQRPDLASKLGLFAPILEVERAEAEDGEGPRPDRPDLALLQDMARTQDPATGTVPSERLLAAALFNEAMLQGVAQRGTSNDGPGNAPWYERGPSNVSGRIKALLVDPADATGNTVWAGAAGGGLWKGTNANTTGVRWTNVNSFLSNLAVTAIAAVPGTSPEVLYCGTGEGFYNADAIRGAGIWKSTDGGATWQQLPATASNTHFQYIQKIVVHPITKDVYAATRAGGLYRSQNGGTSWTQVLNTNTSPASAVTRVADIEIASDQTLFVSFGIFNTDGIYRSATGNVGSWTKLNTLAGSGLPTTGYQRIELACAPSDASRVYAVFQSAAAGTPVLNIYRSLNGGTTWQTLPKPDDADTGISAADFTRGQAWYDLAMAVSPTDPNTLWVGGIDLFKSTNAGAATPTNVSWQQVTHWYGGFNFQEVHADQHVIAFPNNSSGKVYFGNDGGFFFSTNPTAAIPTVTAANNGLNVTQFYGVAMHPTSYNYFLAGAQDNGTQQFSTAGINTTTEVTGGDGGLSAIDQNAPLNQFTSYVYNDYYRSTNGGNTFPTEFAFSSTAGSFINPWDFDSQANVLYAGYNTTTNGVTTNKYLAVTNILTATTINNATKIIPNLGSGTGAVSVVQVSPLTANRIYIGNGPSFDTNPTNDGGLLLRVDNANTATPTIKSLYIGPIGSSISCVAIDPANEQHLLVTLSNYGVVSVLETSNANAATPTWASVEGNLPDMPVRWALFDPRNTSRAILATEMGVYATDGVNGLRGASTVWVPCNSSMVNTRVDMLRFRTGDQLVVAATHGRGLFTSAIFNVATPLGDPPLPVTLVSFTGVRTSAGPLLRWRTATELNSSRFEVQRSGNAVDFITVGTVAAAGTTTTGHTYAYTDASAHEGLQYYRLRQVDMDGTSANSPVVAVQHSGPASTKAILSSAYPNPFASTLTLELAQEPTGLVVVTLTDAQGRRAYAATERPASRLLKVAMPASLAAGSYVLTVLYNGQVSRTRVAKH